MDLRNYIRNYNRVVFLFDAMSEKDSDIVFNLLSQGMMKTYQQEMSFLPKSNNFEIVDEPNDFLEYDVVPRRILLNKIIEKTSVDDYYLMRLYYANSMNGGYILSNQIRYNADLILVLKNKILKCDKDKYGVHNELFDGINIKKFLISYKLNKIIKRINIS